MRCIVTAGPAYEPLDQVRRLTNFSTGRLGTELARYLVASGHEVTLLLGEQATFRAELGAQETRVFSTAGSLRDSLQKLSASPFDAIYHAAAVSDFAFGQVWTKSASGELTPAVSGKFSTRQGTLLAELVPAPKIIAHLRDWFPAATLVGWKYEVEGTRAEVLELAARQIRECRTDACVANGPAYGAGFGVLRTGLSALHCENTPALFKALAECAVSRGKS